MAKKQKTQEDKNIEYLETRYMYESRRNIYIANEEINMAWDESDIPDFIEAWNNNWSLGEIAEYLGADQYEVILLAIDLINKRKIKGNIHIFKPKRKVVKTLEFTFPDGRIRAVNDNGEIWVCLKDVWRWIGKPENSYRKVTEYWGPSIRAKFTLPTKGGPQRFIFTNIRGLSRLCNHVEKHQIVKIQELKEKIEQWN